MKKHKSMAGNQNGVVTYMDPSTSLWYTLYVTNQPSTTREQNLFRQRFRLTYDAFNRLLQDVRNHVIFSRWSKFDAVGDPPVPMELLLLGFLRYVGRGFTFDDLEECTAISRETHRQFMNTFIKYGSSVMWKRYIIKTFNVEDAKYNTNLFVSAGFTGCIGSVDGTHVMIENCSDWAQNKHKGFKLNKPSRNYNVTCNHMREIIGCTRGFPATWNDKSMVLYDELT